ncbi:hypothetical protein Xen7305DRAFT_00032980 [Xenococcus sp. PCC 7305]|uniref:hypothetical protein n=1 Tax=Xenococcus sp. PCC 7305 TaxID=102125 RepID=UPI0002ABB673|nr:hypothetical protein [Xenococcus sp. PCC 7305]ELS03574.1 hypothetical protein Xen7305DRAFT_00032980 [Xenococcus sp. PCC 7305]
MSLDYSEVKVCKEEFEAAESDGYVFGTMLVGTAKAHVYVQLGIEKDYQGRRNDHPNTSYRFFLNSTIYYAKTASDIDNEQYEGSLENLTVIILC